MLVGLFDQDILLNPNRVFPSLELMKYSAYYKSKQDIVQMMHSANEMEPYDKIILHKGKSRGSMPTMLLTNPKVEWIGKYFFGGKTQLPPKEINKMEGDTSVYSFYYEKHKDMFSIKHSKFLERMFYRGKPYRLTHLGVPQYECMPACYERYAFLYDEDIFTCPDAFDILQNYADNTIYFINPQWIYSWDTYLRAHEELPMIARFKNYDMIVYGGEITRSQFRQNYKIFSTRFKLGIRARGYNETAERYVVKELLDKGDFYFYSLAHDKGLQITYLRTPGVPLILEIFCKYTQIAGKTTDNTFFDYISKQPTVRLEAMELEKKYPFLYPIFHSCNKDVAKGGYWRL